MIPEFISSTSFMTGKPRIEVGKLLCDNFK